MANNRTPFVTFCFVQNSDDMAALFHRFKFDSKTSMKRVVRSYFKGNLKEKGKCKYDTKDIFGGDTTEPNGRWDFSDEFNKSLKDSDYLCIISKKSNTLENLIDRIGNKNGVIAVLTSQSKSELSLSKKISYINCDSVLNPGFGENSDTAIEKLFDSIYIEIQKLCYPFPIVSEIKQGTEVLGQFVELDVSDEDENSRFMIQIYTRTMLEYSLASIEARKTYDDFVYMSCCVFVDDNKLSELIPLDSIHDGDYVRLSINNSHDVKKIEGELRILTTEEYYSFSKKVPEKAMLSLATDTSYDFLNTAEKISEISKKLVAESMTEVDREE